MTIEEEEEVVDLEKNDKDDETSNLKSTTPNLLLSSPEPDSTVTKPKLFGLGFGNKLLLKMQDEEKKKAEDASSKKVATPKNGPLLATKLLGKQRTKRINIDSIANKVKEREI